MGAGAQACNSDLGRLRKKERMFKASLGYIARQCLREIRIGIVAL